MYEDRTQNYDPEISRRISHTWYTQAFPCHIIHVQFSALTVCLKSWFLKVCLKKTKKNSNLDFSGF